MKDFILFILVGTITIPIRQMRSSMIANMAKVTQLVGLAPECSCLTFPVSCSVYSALLPALFLLLPLLIPLLVVFIFPRSTLTLLAVVNLFSSVQAAYSEHLALLSLGRWRRGKCSPVRPEVTI